MVSQILGPILLRGIVGSYPPHVVIQGMRCAKRRVSIPFVEPLDPVRALLLLDLQTGSVGEGAEVSGIHRRSVADFVAP